MQEYVLGFMTYWNGGTERVLLIRKARPDWQKGMLNGIGGHIESYDKDPAAAMAREFEEETGIISLPCQWKKFCEMKLSYGVIHCFNFDYGTAIPRFRTMTDEPVEAVSLNKIHRQDVPMVENLPWLIKMIKSQRIDGVKFYRVEYVR